MKIREVLEKLCAYHPAVDEERTCDVVKIGNPDQECTGIAVTVYASIPMIRKAIAQHCNLIIAHEPLFFSHGDQTDWLEGNSVFEEKQKLLADHNIVVFRDHDRIHGEKPGPQRDHVDMIFYGIMKTLGWEDYCVGFDKKPQVYEIPETTLESLMQNMVTKLGLNGARYISNPKAKVKKVFFCEHVNGMNRGGVEKDSELIKTIESNDYDVMIPFEIIDWTLSEYVRDAAALGKSKALIEMGHFNVEEAGMKYMAQWLPEIIENQAPVSFIPSADDFHYYSAE